MSADIQFGDIVRRAQAEAVAKLLERAMLKVLDDKGNLLFAVRMSDKYAVGLKGERIVFEPIGKVEVVAKGKAALCEFYTADGKSLVGRALAGDHSNALVRFEDPQLYERMLVDMTDPIVINMLTKD